MPSIDCFGTSLIGDKVLETCNEGDMCGVFACIVVEIFVCAGLEL